MTQLYESLRWKNEIPVIELVAKVRAKLASKLVYHRSLSLLNRYLCWIDEWIENWWKNQRWLLSNEFTRHNVYKLMKYWLWPKFCCIKFVYIWPKWMPFVEKILLLQIELCIAHMNNFTSNSSMPLNYKCLIKRKKNLNNSRKKRKEISWQQLKPTFYWADAKENLKINFLLLFPCTELPLLFSQFQYTQK